MNACMRSSTCWTFLALVSLFLFAAACGTAGSALETLSPSPSPPGTPIPATSTPTVEIPTPTPTATEEMILAPHRPDLAAGTAGTYSAVQGRLIEAGAFSSQEQVLAAYYQYWAGAANSPVHPPAAEDGLFFIYVFNPEDAADACLAIPATGYSGTDLLAVPYRDGNEQTAPPSAYAAGNNIETNEDPLPLTNSGISTETGAQFQLSCQVGRWVRRDASGAVMERINRQGQWEVDLPWAVNNFGLNPDHRYQLTAVRQDPRTVIRYIQDVDNRGLMLEHIPVNPETGQPAHWEAPSVEIMYAHLVPEDQTMTLFLRKYMPFLFFSANRGGF